MISTGLALGLASSGILVLLTLGHLITPLTAMPLLMLNTFSIGMVTPNVVHGTMEPVPEIAGVASSLFGSARMVAGALSTEVVALCYRGTPLAMTGAMLLFAASAFGFWLLSLRFLNHDGRPAVSQPRPVESPLLLTRADPPPKSSSSFVSSSVPEFVGHGRVKEDWTENEDENENDLKGKTDALYAEVPKESCRTLGLGPRHPGRKCEPRAVER